MGTLLQIGFDIFSALGIFLILMRMSRAPKDDPRLSRGLQLLQSKISVLEDLSDRTETQVGQLAAILEQKAREVQAKIQLAEQHVNEIRISTERSLEVAKIFQDKIPHQEIIERQNTMKYVQAARLAHQGVGVDEISEKVGIPKGEVEFISKVNRDNLIFNEDQLPWWAREQATSANTNDGAAEAANSTQAPAQVTDAPASEFTQTVPGISFAEEPSPAGGDERAQRLRAELELAERQRLVENLSRLQFEMQNLDMQLVRTSGVRGGDSAFEAPKVESPSLQKIGDEFRKACEEAEQDASRTSIFPPLVRKAADSLFAQAAGPMAAMTEMMQAVSPPPVPAARPAVAAPSVPPELASARSAARETIAPTPIHLVRSEGSGKGSQPPVIRRVQFPRIDNET